LALGAVLILRSWAALLVATGGCLGAAAAQADPVTDLSKLSLEELAEVQVTSVSKRPEPIGEAPSSVFVISQEDIARSGAMSLPEVLRLAPNLQVAQVSASRYVITARGANGVTAAQNFANKLLVLIDGRTVYSPLFSGVYWDMQDVFLPDVERIEVISGPGATLWGANAVNGVINIITRASADTQGGAVQAALGVKEGRAAVRFGGRLSDALTYRIYGGTYLHDDTRLATGAWAHDHWSRPQGGFRLDWTASERDAVTLQGDGYSGSESQSGADPEDIKGANLSARWTRTTNGGGSLQVQAYYDRTERSAEVDGSGFWVDTYDLDLQRSTTLGERQQIVFGGGFRSIRYKIFGTPTLFWVPASRTLQLGNAFIQDAVTLTPSLKLVLGAKVEADPYLQPELLPSARLSWTPSERLNLWGAVSRAIRSPTPFDRDVVEKLAAAAPPFLIGDSGFQAETLTSYELGAKIYPSRSLALTVTGYYHHYDQLRSIEFAPAGFLPLQWGNGMRGRIYGFEAWSQYQPTSWWRLSASLTHLQEKFWFKPGASGLLGPSQAANDPKYQATLASSMSFAPMTLDAWVRHVSALLDPHLPAYTELNARVGWRLTEQLTVAIDGRNLLHDQHLEYTAGNQIPRSVLAELQWRF